MSKVPVDSKETFDALIKQYRNLGAPPHLSGKILAHTSDLQTRANWHWPVTGAVTAILIGSLTFFLSTPGPTRSTVSSNTPTLSSLATKSLQKPANIPTSLSQLHLPARPVLPKKPKILTPEKPVYPSNNDARLKRDKENTHVYT